MNRVHVKAGFTLMEIIVVMIILGIVASIALPNVFGQIERNRAQEGISNMSPIRQLVDACIAANGGSSFGCNFPTVVSPNFSYLVTVADTNVTATGVATITATRAQNGGGAIVAPGVAGSTVVLTRGSNVDGGAWNCSGTGVYVGVCR